MGDKTKIEVMNEYENDLFDLKAYMNDMGDPDATPYIRAYLTSEIKSLLKSIHKRGEFLGIPKMQIIQDINEATNGERGSKRMHKIIDRKKKLNKPKTKRCVCKK